MDIRTIIARRRRAARVGVASLVLAAALIAATSTAAADAAPDAAVKAAFLYNFAKFTEWPALLPDAPLVVCIVDSDAIAAAFVETVHGQQVAGHRLEVWRPQDGSSWRTCNLVFVADPGFRLAKQLVEIKTLPVLTVGDGRGFSQAGGIIELYLEGGKMHFSVNLDAAERAGIRLSSRLLTLAKIIRSSHDH